MEQRKILVVEDHPDVVEIIQKQLAHIGYPKSSVVQNGPDALKMAREEKPDLILMDLRLPGMNGYDVIRGLKAHPSTSAIPILGMTASTAPSDRMKLRESGCDAFLPKPFLIRQLKLEIEKLFRRTH